MAQATSGERSTSSQRRRAGLGPIAVLIVVGAFCAAVFILEPQIANPSVASCLLLIIGAPLLAIVRFLDRRSRRRRISEIRDARRSGISIGSTRSRVEGALTNVGIDVSRASARALGDRMLDDRAMDNRVFDNRVFDNRVLDNGRRLDSGRHADAASREL